MKRPLVGLVIAFALGIWLASLVTLGMEWWWGAAGVLGTFFFWRQWRAAVFAFVFVAGVLAYRAAQSTSDPHHIVNLLGREPVRAELRGVVVSDPTGRKSFQVDVSAVKSGEEWVPAAGRLWVFLRQERVVRYGEEWEFGASIREPEAPRNPGVFQWKQWLAERRIFLTATIWPRDRCELVATGRGNPVTTLALQVRARLEEAIAAGIADEPGLVGVLAGMVIGERAEIPPDTYTAFQQTGVFHVFAVSGLHVGLVTAVVLVALRLARVPRRWCGIIAMPLLVLYVFATGARPGAVRALLMACVWLTGWILVRPSDLLNGLAGAALAILVYEPLQLFDGGFQLSFGVVVALVTLTPPIEKLLYRLIAHDPFVPEELLPRWRKVLREPIQYGVRLVAGSMAAWVGLIPLMAVYFHLFTPVSVLANVVVVPLLGIIMAVGMLAILAHPVCVWLAETFNNANYALLHGMTATVQWLGHLPCGHWFVQAPPVWMSVVYYGLGIAGLKWRRVWWLVPVLICGVAFWPERAVEITVLDMNRGGAIFVNAPGERDDFLIDGGDDWAGKRVVVPFLQSEGVDRLSAVVLTRGDKNHATGLREVLAGIPVGEAAHAGLWTRSEAYAEWLGDVQRRGIPLRKLRAGEQWRAARVFHPTGAGETDRSDDYVVVLGLEYNGTRLVLLGDASAEVLGRIRDAVRDYRPQLVVQGSDGAGWEATREFLAAVRPELAVICRPQPSRFHPRRDLSNSPVPLLRTDDTGAVTLRLTEKGYSVKTMLSGSEH